MGVEDILVLFRLEGDLLEAAPYGDGHINQTYRVRTTGGEYILQHLSPAAFKEPGQVMENVSRVTGYLREVIARRGGDPARETLRIIPLKDGREYLLAHDGCWRMYIFIPAARSYTAATPALFREAGRGFGRFMRDLTDYPASTLHETIPNFHHTPSRLEAFRQAVARDAAHRAAGAEGDIQAYLQRGHRAAELTDAGLPLRVTHNDTKLNNVLMDDATGKALCVIDLDTVMPGLCAYDFGDAIRYGTNTAAEDERDLTRVHFSLDMFRAFTEGYLGEAGSMSRAEILSLPLGAWMMTYECGMRFLTDYLNGDAYFRTAYPEHNLVRARNQMALLADMEKQESAMHDIIKDYCKE